jgi:hypothetical protein
LPRRGVLRRHLLSALCGSLLAEQQVAYVPGCPKGGLLSGSDNPSYEQLYGKDGDDKIHGLGGGDAILCIGQTCLPQSSTRMAANMRDCYYLCVLGLTDPKIPHTITLRGSVRVSRGQAKRKNEKAP